jgi:predicted RNase H-like HicB family nuclease
VIITGTITTPDGGYEHVATEGNTYDEALENLYALLAEGQKLIAILTDR